MDQSTRRRLSQAQVNAIRAAVVASKDPSAPNQKLTKNNDPIPPTTDPTRQSSKSRKSRKSRKNKSRKSRKSKSRKSRR